MDHCTKCGKKLEDKRGFCTGCGQPVQQVMKVTPSRVKRSGPKPIIIGIALFVLIGLLIGGAFYIGGKYSNQKTSVGSHDAALKKDEKASTNEEKSETDQNKAKEETKEKPEPNQDSKPEKNASEDNTEVLDINSAIKELNKLSIHANGRDIYLGEWDITKNENS